MEFVLLHCATLPVPNFLTIKQKYILLLPEMFRNANEVF